jgi:two-component system OmpR family sensor kinase
LTGHAIDTLQALIGRRHVALDVPHGTAPVLCQERLIVRVLVNLLVNAIRATAEDGGIRVLVKPLPERVRISVTDDGPGIPPEAQATLFEQFGHWEGTRPASEPHSATRVGLAFSRLVAEAHGGAVGVDSEIGNGATLWVEIPRDDSRGRAKLAAEAGDAS